MDKLPDTYSQNLILLDHHLVKSNSLFNINKLESTEHYYIVNSSRNSKHTSQIHFKKKFSLRKVTRNTYLNLFSIRYWTIFFIWMRNFLSLDFPQLSFWTFYHLAPSAILVVKISFIVYVIVLWKKLELKLKDNITLLPLTPQVTTFGFLETDCQELYIYKSRKINF